MTTVHLTAYQQLLAELTDLEDQIVEARARERARARAIETIHELN